MKIVFFGTPEFAQIILNQLLVTAAFKVPTIVTAPDQPIGRQQTLTPPPVKVLAQKRNISVLQPKTLDAALAAELKKIKPDIILVAAYGKIIPQNILDIPTHGCLNVHPSLLPQYRGASPIQSALLNGDQETGVTLMLMDEQLDHGPILAEHKTQLTEHEKFKELHDRLALLSAELLIKTLPDYLAGKIKPHAQDDQQATFCKTIKKTDGEINWQHPAEKIYNQWRAFNSWPGIFSQLTIRQLADNKPARLNDFSHSGRQLIIKFIEIKLVTPTLGSDKNPGEFFVQDRKLFVTCGNQTILEVLQIQPEGKKIMTAQSFMNGYLK